MSWKEKIVRSHQKSPDIINDERIITRIALLITAGLIRDLSEREREELAELRIEHDRRGLDQCMLPEDLAEAEAMDSHKLWDMARDITLKAVQGRFDPHAHSGFCAAASRVIAARLLATAVPA